jgi:hypothetical protein
MIAAQALVHRATLITRNPDDFRDVPGLDQIVPPRLSDPIMGRLRTDLEEKHEPRVAIFLLSRWNSGRLDETLPGAHRAL